VKRDKERGDGDYGPAILFGRPGQINQGHIADLIVEFS
jgi:hypothetical protein